MRVRGVAGVISFRVYGLPAPQGSKRHVGNGVMVESSKRVKPWRQDVKYAALEAQPVHWSGCREVLSGPLRAYVTFYLPRPKGHYRTGRNAALLRDSAPRWPGVKPDVDKLLRSTLDALGEAGVWQDDAQVVRVTATKAYATDTEPPGAAITVEAMPCD